MYNDVIDRGGGISVIEESPPSMYIYIYIYHIKFLGNSTKVVFFFWVVVKTLDVSNRTFESTFFTKQAWTGHSLM